MTLLTALLLVLVCASTLKAEDGIRPYISYTEPTTTDLKEICAEWWLDQDAPTTACWPASGLKGGAMIENVTPILAPIMPGEKKTWSARFYAVNSDAVAGDKTSISSLVADRAGEVVPPPPPPPGPTIAAVLSSCRWLFTVTAPGATSVRLMRDGVASGAADKTAPFVFDRTWVRGTYAVAADVVTPQGTTRTPAVMIKPDCTIGAP